jgi:hypothetical protein
MKRLLFQPPKPEDKKPDTGKPDAPKTPDPAVQKASQEIADLSMLKLLQPIKFTVRQIDKLLVPMRDASQAAVKLDKEDADALKEIAPLISKAREGMLAGKGMPPETADKINEMYAASDVRRLAARKKAGDAIVTVFKNELSIEQTAEVDKVAEKLLGYKPVPKEYADKPAKAPKEMVSNILARAFIDQVMLFDKTIVLLEAMKKVVPPKESKE